MINKIQVAVAKLALALAFAAALIGQDTADFERRLQELERKMRQLDPSFSPAEAVGNLSQRLAALERRMDEVLAARSEKSLDPPSAPPASLPLQPVGPLTGYRTSPNEEQRLPVSGYMDFHFNKPRGEPGQLDFHRFVVQFGHNFAERIKFWSELEVEHGLVEGREEKGELELEQAYLDFLIKPWFNLRGGMILTPMGIMNERHEPPSFNGVERP